MDYSNPAATFFRDSGGLDNTIARLKLEVCHFDERLRKPSGESQSSSKGKSPQKNVVGSEETCIAQPETLVPYHRRLLMNALL